VVLNHGRIAWGSLSERAKPREVKLAGVFINKRFLSKNALLAKIIVTISHFRTKLYITEPILMDSYRQMLGIHAHDCSVDRIFEDPNLRGEFLGLVRLSLDDRPEFEILRGLSNLRKKSKLPRRNEDRE